MLASGAAAPDAEAPELRPPLRRKAEEPMPMLPPGHPEAAFEDDDAGGLNDDADDAEVFFGLPLRWNAGVSINF